MRDFDYFIGQEHIKKELVGITSAIKDGSDLNINILFTGSGGCGKTLLAKVFCSNLAGSKYKLHLASNSFKWESSFNEYRYHIIDEIHLLSKNPEIIFPYLDSPKFIIVGCTTNSGDLNEPFLSRFYRYNFRHYKIRELQNIIYNHSLEIKFEISTSAAKFIAKRCRNNPRVGKSYLERVYFLISSGYYSDTESGIKDALEDIGVLNGGYTDIDVNYINFLAKNGVSSLSLLCNSLDVDKNTIVNYIEPFLVEKGHIIITPKGRKLNNSERL